MKTRYSNAHLSLYRMGDMPVFMIKGDTPAFMIKGDAS
jgi:hypothetical protein